MQPLRLTYEPGPWARCWTIYAGKDEFGRDVYDRFVVPIRPVEWIDLKIEIVPPALLAAGGA